MTSESKLQFNENGLNGKIVRNQKPAYHTQTVTHRLHSSENASQRLKITTAPLQWRFFLSPGKGSAGCENSARSMGFWILHQQSILHSGVSLSISDDAKKFSSPRSGKFLSRSFGWKLVGSILMSSIHLQGMTPCCFCKPFWQMNSTDSQWPGHEATRCWKSIGKAFKASHAEGKLFWTDQPIATELWEIRCDDATMSVAKKAQHLTTRLTDWMFFAESSTKRTLLGATPDFASKV